MKNFLFHVFLVGVIIIFSPVYASAAMSSDAQELKALYGELQEFKDNPKFHQVGFGTCCRFNNWMVKIKAIRSKKTGIKILRELGFLPGDLLQLGMEYMKSRGRPTRYSQEMEATVVAGLASEPQLEEGQGVVVKADRACVSLDSFKKFITAMTARKYGEASTIISGSDCPRVYEKTVVTGPLASEHLPWEDGSSSTYHQVKMPDGTTLWMSASQVKFN